MSVVSVYCTFADIDEARRIGRSVVDERLAACVNILGECQSIYRWGGKIEEAPEVAAIFKSTRQGAGALADRIAELHSYDVPAVVIWPAEAPLPTYAAWVEDSVGGQG